MELSTFLEYLHLKCTCTYSMVSFVQFSSTLWQSQHYKILALRLHLVIQGQIRTFVLFKNRIRWKNTVNIVMYYIDKKTMLYGFWIRLNVPYDTIEKNIQSYLKNPNWHWFRCENKLFKQNLYYRRLLYTQWRSISVRNFFLSDALVNKKSCITSKETPYTKFIFIGSL